MENVKVLSIRHEKVVLYDCEDEKKKANIDMRLENLLEEDRGSYELLVKAQDREGKPCEVCRVKYVRK